MPLSNCQNNSFVKEVPEKLETKEATPERGLAKTTAIPAPKAEIMKQQGQGGAKAREGDLTEQVPRLGYNFSGKNLPMGGGQGAKPPRQRD